MTDDRHSDNVIELFALRLILAALRYDDDVLNTATQEIVDRGPEVIDDVIVMLANRLADVLADMLGGDRAVAAAEVQRWQCRDPEQDRRSLDEAVEIARAVVAARPNLGTVAPGGR